MDKLITLVQKTASEDRPDRQKVNPEFIRGLLATGVLKMDKFLPVDGVSIICEIGGKCGNFKLKGKMIFGTVLFVENFNGKVLGLSERHMNAVEQWFKKGAKDVK